MTTAVEASAPDRRPITRIPHLLYGADYNPEQWPEAVWLEDARLMRMAGVNMMTIGIFAWTRLEPAPGAYTFAWLDRVVDLLHSNGVAVDLATPTASPPAWLVRLHPEILPETITGSRLWHGSRRHYCPHSVAYRDAARGLVRALAEHYRDHPAVALWHVDNEYACHVTECFCDASSAAFRDWLRRRHGSIAGLNAAWATTFWNQEYTDWEEVHPPRLTPTFPNPSQRLDWQRFCSDSWLACYTDQEAILREVTPTVPITTNYMGFHKPLDYWTWTPHQDIVSNDSYPETSDPEWMIDAGMICDLIRSLGHRRPWMLMEQAAGHVNWRQRNTTKRPGVMRLGSYQAVARGADAIMFFQWRASPAGAEKYHSAMIGHGGASGRVWAEVQALGAELASLDELVASQVESEVAVLFDWQSWWALEGEGRPSNDIRLMDGVRAAYAALFRRGVTVDFVHPSADLSRYRLLIAPTLHLVDDPAVDNIRAWVRGGGTLVASFHSGIVDGNDHIRLGGYPAPFTDLFGLVVEEWAPYAVGQANVVRTAGEEEYGCEAWSDILRIEGADVVATYRDDFFAGQAAVTQHAFGTGTGIYVGTQLDAAGTSWLMDRACAVAGVAVDSRTPRDVEVVRRTLGSQRWLFLLNHAAEPAEVNLDRAGLEVLSGALVDGTVTVGPRGVAIVRSFAAGE